MGLRVQGGGDKENVCQEVHHQEKQHSAEEVAPLVGSAEPVSVQSCQSTAELSAEPANPGDLAEHRAPANHLGLPANWRAGESRETVDATATKVDDAAVPIELWNDVLLEDLERETQFSHKEQVLEVL